MRVLILCCLAGIIIGCSPVFASTCLLIFPKTSTISIGTITVQRDAAVGTVLFSQKATSTKSYLERCFGTLTLRFSMRYYNAIRSSYGDHVYDTNISGVGIRFSSGKFFDNPGTTFPYPMRTSYVEWFGGKVELIVTGPVSPGLLNSGVLGVIAVKDRRGAFVNGLTTMITGGRINVVACSVNTKQLNFPLGNVPVSAFGSSPGTHLPGVQNTQNLGLTCNEGTNINLSISGVKNPDINATSVLSLTGQGQQETAKGVGVQLLYNGKPLVLNSKIRLKSSATGHETFPLTARYYQTLASVTPGTANASATLNLTYQ